MDASPLWFSLPAEIRNHIYALVLTEPVPIILRLRKYTQEDHFPWKPRSLATQLALTHTCRKICAESRQMFYAVNRFVINLDSYGVPPDGRVLNWTLVYSNRPLHEFELIDKYLAPLYHFLDKTAELNVMVFGNITVSLPIMSLTMIRIPEPESQKH
jgi:hypothetical protein